MMKKISALLSLISSLAFAVFAFLFVQHNAPGLDAPVLISCLAGAYTLIYLFMGLKLASACFDRNPDCDQASVMAGRIILPLFVGLLLWVFLDATVFDYYQPISLFDDAIAALAVSWAVLCFLLLLFIIFTRSISLEMLRGALLMAIVALLGWPLAASLDWINAPAANSKLALHKDIFIGGQDGYDIYRIPGLVVLPGGSTLANGKTLSDERTLAFAEARLDGALDTGAIDLVMKFSDDGGANWSKQQLVCRNETDTRRGKCGNATPLFDTTTGTVLLPYNLSGISATADSGRHHSSELKTSTDGGITWSGARTLATDNLVFGPGHGIQKLQAPHVGRLLIPGYLKGHAMVLFSDDHGASWQRGDKLNTGNETEIAELSDGRIYLATRHNAPIGRPPEPNGRLFSLSLDGGVNWSLTETDTRLATPICQASVVRYGDNGGLLFSNPAHHKARVNMRVRYSADDGENWSRDFPVYSGPAGYSVLGVADNGDALLLYERGNMSYSEKISFARIPASQFQ